VTRKTTEIPLFIYKGSQNDHFWFLVFDENNPKKTREFFGGYVVSKTQKPKMKFFVFCFFCPHLAREIEKNTKMIIFGFWFSLTIWVGL